MVNIKDSYVNDITSSSGVVLNGTIRAEIAETQLTRMPNGAGVAVLGGADVVLDHVRSHNNQFGVLVAGPNTAVVRLKDCVLHGTSNSVSNGVGATVTPFTSNVLLGGAAVGLGASVAPN
jgi:hypothetical protein